MVLSLLTALLGVKINPEKMIGGLLVSISVIFCFIE